MEETGKQQRHCHCNIRVRLSRFDLVMPAPLFPAVYVLASLAALCGSWESPGMFYLLSVTRFVDAVNSIESKKASSRYQNAFLRECEWPGE